jgi:ABC-type transport system involved in cytochrome c biogenesis ATPase subunit
MLTHLNIRNFKRFDDVSIELGKSVVFIGPNNRGKTTALQALVLWDIGLRQWNAKREGKESPEKRSGVAINRRDLFSIPVPIANLLWRNLHVRGGGTKEDGQPRTINIRIEIEVSGITNNANWIGGFEFDYANEESFYCRPLREKGYEDSHISKTKFTQVPPEASSVKVAYLPPMSGLATDEPKWELGRINVLIGQGQTAQVLRNLCYQIYIQEDQSSWNELTEHIQRLFGADLSPPKYFQERGEITMEYKENGNLLDLSCAGRGLQQTLLLLAHLYANPNTVLLLDEPDAHLEIFRQRQTYQLLSEIAEAQGSQVIAASHSEVVLEEAAGRGKVVAFVGKPHTMNDRSSQVIKSLTDIGWDQYYQAEQTGWVLYLEGPSDLAILKSFAKILEHNAMQVLERPFVHYVSTNLPHKARDHFFGLCEGKPDLIGIAIFDRLEKELKDGPELREMMWRRCEIENYLCQKEVLINFARHSVSENHSLLMPTHEKAMQNAIEEVTNALKTLYETEDPWSPNIKATDAVLDPIFKRYFKKLDLPLEFRKRDYFQLAQYIKKDAIDKEIIEKLDAILVVAQAAKPRE